MPTLCKVLNIAAGFLPLVASDLEQSGFFDVDKVVNFDPLKDNVLKALFDAIIKQYPDIIYQNQQAGVNQLFPNGSVDLIIGVSPYNFSLVDTWADQKLKPGGVVLVVANEGNKYVKDSKLFAPAGLKDKYAEICNAGSWIDYIIAKIKQDYPSHTSKLEKGTPLNKVRILKKTGTNSQFDH